MPKKARRRVRGSIARRWFALAALVLIGLLYYRPLHDYLDARGQQAARVAAVRKLQREQDSLEARLRRASAPTTLAREARELGYVRPGQHLYIVKNLPHWRRRQNGPRHASGR